MRRTVALMTSMALTLLMASSVALALNTIRCDGGKCNGTPRDDEMLGSIRRDIMYGFKGQDRLWGRAGGDDLYGFEGYDYFRGGDGGDKLGGGEERDGLHGESGPDVLKGGDQADQLKGGDGDDKLFAGSGGSPNGYFENLNGGGGSDQLAGGPGLENYRFASDWGNDTISDSNADSVGFQSQKDLSIRLRAGAGPEATDGTNSVGWGDTFAISSLVGGNGDDTITGDGRSNVLTGSEGSDTINGGGGNDLLYSGTTFADDFVPDTIDCGPGTDTVFFDPTLDTVTNCENLNPE